MEQGSGSRNIVATDEWSEDEDKLICRVWMNSGLWMNSTAVTTDAGPLKMSRHWKNVNDAFVASSKQKRSEQQFQLRWSFLLKKMEDFTPIYKSVQNTSRSSISGSHSATVAHATKYYKESFGNDFEYLTCWEILKDMLVNLS